MTNDKNKNFDHTKQTKYFSLEDQFSQISSQIDNVEKIEIEEKKKFYEGI